VIESEAVLASEGTGELEASDPHGLLESGEELATRSELARLLGCSNRALHQLLSGPLSKRVRFVRDPKPWRFSVADARAAFEPYRAEIESRRQRAIALDESNRAARAAKIAASQVAPPEARPAAATPAAKPGGLAKGAPVRKTSAPAPEVFVIARRPSVRP
jgi:hypothetical protein